MNGRNLPNDTGSVVASLRRCFGSSLADNHYQSAAGICPVLAASAVFLAAIVCVWAVLEQEWVGLVFGVAVLCIEAFSMTPSYAETGSTVIDSGDFAAGLSRPKRDKGGPPSS